MSLGKLERVDLRDIWGHEASGFTSWLARDENLAELGQVMGMKLELVGQERDIEPFRADILCRDALTKNYVIIKSQLENTNPLTSGKFLLMRQDWEQGRLYGLPNNSMMNIVRRWIG